MTLTTGSTRAPRERILSPAYAATTIGMFGLIAFVAFESMAVSTLMPTVARDLLGLGLYALPFAAPLASGVPLSELGPPIDPDALVRLDLPQPRFTPERIDATMLYVDSFGNIALNLTREDVEQAGVVPGSRVELELAGERYFAVTARTFADARAGDVILYEDSYRNMSVAINRGNAASMLHAAPGRPIGIRVLGPAAVLR